MKKRLFYIIMATVIAISCIACSSKNSSASYAAYDTADYYYEPAEAEMMYEEARGGSGINASSTANAKASSSSNSTSNMPDETARKLIRDASLTVETKEFDALIDSLEAQIRSFGGYIESMSQSGNSYNSYSSYSYSKNNRYASVHARIPADQLDDFLSTVDGLGNVTHKSLSTRDVTSTYVDIESRLKVLNTEKESLEKIMASAENTTDMLEVQSRLYDVIEEIESYEARKRTYDSLISYSSVDLSVQEVVELTPAKEETRWEELARRFTSSLGDLGDAIVEMGIGFIVALPWLIVFGGIITGIVLVIVLPIRAKNKKRRAKQLKEAEEKIKQQ